MARRLPFIAWLLIAGLAAAMFFVNPLADVAARFSREVTVATGALYGTLRVANSLMSVAKDADVTGGVGVASVTASPGQLLQPVTNTVDRMAGGDRALGAILLPASYSLAFYAGNAITEEAWQGATQVFQRMDAEYKSAAVEQQVEVLKDAKPPAAIPSVTEEEGIFDRLGFVVDASRSAISGTLGAASGLAQSATSGVSENAGIITDGVAISADLFSVSIAIAVAYLVKLLVLPLMIFGALVYVLRAAIR